MRRCRSARFDGRPPPCTKSATVVEPRVVTVFECCVCVRQLVFCRSCFPLLSSTRTDTGTPFAEFFKIFFSVLSGSRTRAHVNWWVGAGWGVVIANRRSVVSAVVRLRQVDLGLGRCTKILIQYINNYGTTIVFFTLHNITTARALYYNIEIIIIYIFFLSRRRNAKGLTLFLTAGDPFSRSIFFWLPLDRLRWLFVKLAEVSFRKYTRSYRPR